MTVNISKIQKIKQILSFYWLGWIANKYYGLMASYSGWIWDYPPMNFVLPSPTNIKSSTQFGLHIEEPCEDSSFIYLWNEIYRVLVAVYKVCKRIEATKSYGLGSIVTDDFTW